MPQIFHKRSNSISKVTIVAILILVAAAGGVILVINRTPYISYVGLFREQPVPFSHEHHVRGVGIDCRYCHTSVETSNFAGIPTTKTCMTCHSQIYTDAPLLEPVRESFKTGNPIPWTRVHDLPDFVFFNHSIHISKGVACATCHGPVETMPLMRKESTLNMEWCIQCHKNPGQFIGPKEAVFLPKADGQHMLEELAGGKDAEQIAHARLRLTEDYRVHRKIDCSVCHR